MLVLAYVEQILVPALRPGMVVVMDNLPSHKVKGVETAIQAAGFGWVRQEFIWDQIEPGAKGNHYDTKNQVDAWAKWDRIVNAAQQYHVQLIVRLDYAPTWATTGNPDSGKCPTLCPPRQQPTGLRRFRLRCGEALCGQDCRLSNLERAQLAARVGRPADLASRLHGLIEGRLHSDQGG